MGRMIFELTDEDREALEAIRKARGNRSHAETLRELIRNYPVEPPYTAEDARRDDLLFARTFRPHPKAPVPTMQRKAFNPQPKKGK